MAASTSPSRKHLPAGRTLHLVDIENLAGGSAADAAVVAEAVERYRRTIAVTDDDHVIVGSGPTLAVTAGRAWPGARLVLGRGVDGADRALLEATDPAFVAARFDRVVIGSGDHAFAPLVAELRRRGTAVVVTRREGTTSVELRRLTLCRPLAVTRAA